MQSQPNHAFNREKTKKSQDVKLHFLHLYSRHKKKTCRDISLLCTKSIPLCPNLKSLQFKMKHLLALLIISALCFQAAAAPKTTRKQQTKTHTSATAKPKTKGKKVQGKDATASKVTFEVGDFVYNINSDNKSVSVSLKNGKRKNTIPESVKYNGVSYPVTSIADNAFLGCDWLTSITIPASVTSIGDNAFLGCCNLTSVSIQGALTSIGSDTFGDCKALADITIPGTVTSIGNDAFRLCSSLTSIVIPNSVTEIGERAFLGCSGLTSLSISSTITTIGESVFDSCSGLTAITIPSTVTSISDCAFTGCTGLTNITIPKSVTSIGERAFFNCGITEVHCLNPQPPTVGDAAFDYGNNIIVLYVPNKTNGKYKKAKGWREFKKIKTERKN